ncbi:CvpA family protein [Natronogracilivirga saccharolytica]|uniref:CvpA family protein n=1 Tax=Natronogracilivirga saccharolytica TaxID=2812953 RepID=A0A8J7S7D1_9BACT|nr:CvpA family protein [Natronogracilivirga saccharolytica]MBP3191573.1 CvpA family protein [Natronogracilivirga saccharolytica]
MSLLDGIILIILLVFAWKGFRNGLVKEVFRIAGLVLAGFVSFQYADLVSQLLKPFLGVPDEFLPYIGFAFLFIFALLAVHIAIFFIDSLIQLLLLSIPNKLLGSFFGLLKSSLFISILLIFFSGFGFPDNGIKQNSLLYKPILKVAPASYDIVARVLPGVKPYKDSVERYISVPD